jgi:hypothetical protein
MLFVLAQILAKKRVHLVGEKSAFHSSPIGSAIASLRQQGIVGTSGCTTQAVTRIEFTLGRPVLATITK